MAAHASWKGFLKLSLVSVPVKAYTATASGNDITLHQLHAKTHTRIQYKKVAPRSGRSAAMRLSRLRVRQGAVRHHRRRGDRQAAHGKRQVDPH